MNGGDGAENEERVFSMLRLVGTNISKSIGVKTHGLTRPSAPDFE